MLLMVYVALRMIHSTEAGIWRPDTLEWVKDAKIFEDWVATGEGQTAALLAEEELE